MIKLNTHLEMWGERLVGEYAAAMLDIWVHEYREVAEIWALVPIVQWQMYETMGIDNLREQQLLDVALRNLKNKFNLEVLDRDRPKTSDKKKTGRAAS